jgi:predicted dehydrogenase
MKKLKLGIIGLGHMARNHLVNIRRNPRIELVAGCDRDAAAAGTFPAPEIERFADTQALLDAGLADAILVCTHHSDHTETGIAVLERGVHLLMEKPLALDKAACERLVAAHRDPEQVFGVVLNQRTDPRFRWAKSLIAGGDLGDVMRVQWTITDWFRTDAYYRQTPWFATWSGGGGVLMTQALHQLDILVWLCGLPTRVSGHAHLGKWHDIAVDDDVTAYLEFADGATGVFITSTGETPGSNRLEICGDRGRIVIEGEMASFQRNETPASVLRRTAAERSVPPQFTRQAAPDNGKGGQHAEILDNFVAAVLDRAPLIAPAGEGKASVELANAIHLSSICGKAIDLPLEADRYSRALADRVASETR